MKLKKTISMILAATLMLFAFAGCSQKNESVTGSNDISSNSTDTSSGGTDTSSGETEKPTESNNSGGVYTPVSIENYNRTVEFKEKPEKVVVLTLNSAEILAALGEADSIVAIARNANVVDDVLPEYYDSLKDCAFPDEVNNGVPTLEGLLSLDPDMVVCNSYYFNAPQIFGTMEDYQANGVEFYITEGSYVTDCTIENTYNDIRNLGAIFGKQDEAEKLVESMKSSLDSVTSKTKGQESLKVMSFDSMSEDQFTVSGGVGLAQNLIELAGGENIFADTEKQFLNVGIEEIITRNPDVIVVHAYTFLGDTDAQGKIDYLKNTPELAEVPAVKNNRIIVVPLFRVNPSIQNVNYVEDLAAAMYPELFE